MRAGEKGPICTMSPRVAGTGLGGVRASAGPRSGGTRGGGAHPQQLLWEVSSLVDATVHGDEALGCGLVPHVVVVEAGVEHDDGEGQHVAGV